MEIERKFLIDHFPDHLTCIFEGAVQQGYLSTRPVVRIRRTQSGRGVDWRLCIKGDGTISREEIELPLTQDQYNRMAALLAAPPIQKQYRVYALPGGEQLECSYVDAGQPDGFMYAEVEFDTLEAAHAFVPPAFLGREVTEECAFTMAMYWERKVNTFGSGESE